MSIRKFLLRCIGLWTLCMSLALTTPTAQAQTNSTFTYQGRLVQNNAAVTGQCDIQFSLYDAGTGGTQIGETQTVNAVSMADGYFSATLDFGGSAFDGMPRYLSIGVRCPAGSGTFTALDGRVALYGSPFAHNAASAMTLSIATCAPGELLEWSGTEWICGTDDVGESGSGGGDITAVSAVAGLTGGGPSGSVSIGIASSYQLPQGCGDGEIPEWTGGEWICASDDVGSGSGGGSITGVTAGVGLTGGGTEGNVAVALDGAYQLPQDCQNGEIAEWDGARWSCGGDDVGEGGGGGDITGVTADFGLLGGGQSGDATIRVDDTVIQRRIEQSCPAGSSIQKIFENGQVSCETDDVGAGGEPTWALAGNAGTTPGTNFLGTTDNQPLEVRVNGNRALRIEPGSSPNIVAGHAGNTAGSGVVGGTVSGGGNSGASNSLTDNYASIGGGTGNQAGNNNSDLQDATFATVGGGSANQATGALATIGGGLSNTATSGSATVAGGQLNKATGFNTTVSGGSTNVATGDGSAIGGGSNNSVAEAHGTIGGGLSNSVTGVYGTIAGGQEHTASASASVGGGFSNDAAAIVSTIGGGAGNSITGEYGTIGGGGWTTGGDQATANRVTGNYGTIGGGGDNEAGANGTVAGGQENEATGGSSAIGGGFQNIASGTISTIGGGIGNQATAEFATIGGGGWTTAGDPATANRVTGDYGTIGGGGNNLVEANGTVAGGRQNTARGGSSTIGGGFRNFTSGISAVIGGGTGNSVNADYATVGGGGWTTADDPNTANRASATYSTISGGGNNQASSSYATVGGGNENHANGNFATVAGGDENGTSAAAATISGGQNNTASGFGAAVGGGANNVASGNYATVPGGRDNTAAGIASFAAGQRATVAAAHDGAMLFADFLGFDFNSAAANEFAVRATGGVRFVSAVSGGNPSAGVTLAPGGGSFSSLSDRNAKENVEEVDTQEVLQQLAAMPVATWNYKTQDEDIRHMGPMAQDFYAAFGVGEDETRISTIDADGIALAAIQGLYEIVQEQEERIAALEAEIASDVAISDAKINPLREWTGAGLVVGLLAVGLVWTGRSRRSREGLL